MYRVIMIMVLISFQAFAMEGSGSKELTYSAYFPDEAQENKQEEKNNESNNLKALLKHYAERKVEAIKKLHNDPFHFYIAIGDIEEACKFIIKQTTINLKTGAEEHNLNKIMLERQSSDGFKPLHIAAGYDNIVMLRCLLVWGADKFGLTQKGHNTPLHLAVSTQVVEALLLNSDENEKATFFSMKNADGKTPVHSAISYDRIGIVQYFFRLWDTYFRDEDHTYENLMHYAESKGMKQLIEFYRQQNYGSKK